jgi:integrase
MMAGIHKLSAAKVAKVTAPGRYGDGGGLWLQVTATETKQGPSTAKSWLFRYMLYGKARQMGLGPVHTVTLAEARDKARQARALLLEGIDPIDARHGRRADALAEAAKQITFKDAAEKYIAAHRAGWKNEKHGEQWKRTLENYAFPIMGNMAVASVDTAHVLKVLEPIWNTKTETASRVRGRMESVLDWAKARHYRRGENPARWRGHLDKLLPAKAKVRKVKHHDAMPYGDVPAFVAELRDNDSISARALEFTILTAARTGEVIGARWPEIDLAAKVWTVPAERTKSSREHRVPLTERAVEILASLPREEGNDHVFIGARKGKGLSNMAMLELLRGMVENGLTVHGFRSSFRDWAGERTNFPREVAEAALAHVLTDKTEAAYRRGDALEKRRQLMTAWTRYCATTANGGDVVPMQGRAAS